MSTAKFITFTDIHISDTNPASRMGNYQDDILAKLKQIGQVGKKLGVDFYIMAGDLYHLKAPTRNSHAQNRKLIEVFREFGAPIYATEGNHDLRQDSYTIFGEQSLSVLYADKTLLQVRDEIIDINGMSVRLSAIPFDENPDLKAITPSQQSTDADLHVSILHLYATPKGGDLFGQKLYSYEEISQLGDDIFILGHYHIDQGVQKIGNQYFINVGAISRGSLTEDEITREPKICYIVAEMTDDKLNIKAQPVKLRVKPADQVFNIEEKKAEKKKIQVAEEFVTRLQEEMVMVGDNANSVDEEIDHTNLEKPVIDKVKYYLSEADLKLKEIK